MYSTALGEAASLTHWWSCFGHFVARELSVFGYPSVIGNGVTENLWKGCAKNYSPFSETRSPELLITLCTLSASASSDVVEFGASCLGSAIFERARETARVGFRESGKICG